MMTKKKEKTMGKKKINWYGGKNAINPVDMQELCDDVAELSSPQNLAEIIKGGDEVVVDVAEDNESLEIHLDNNVIDKINNSLQRPNQAPSATELVAVDSNNEQAMLSIGDGLSVSDGSVAANLHIYHGTLNFVTVPFGMVDVDFCDLAPSYDEFKEKYSRVEEIDEFCEIYFDDNTEYVNLPFSFLRKEDIPTPEVITSLVIFPKNQEVHVSGFCTNNFNGFFAIVPFNEISNFGVIL